MLGEVVPFVKKPLDHDQIELIARNWSRFCERMGVPFGDADAVAGAIEAKVACAVAAETSRCAKVAQDAAIAIKNMGPA